MQMKITSKGFDAIKESIAKDDGLKKAIFGYINVCDAVSFQLRMTSG